MNFAHHFTPDISRIAVIVASLGRPDNLAMLLDQLSQQTLLPAQVILSVESDADLPPAPVLARQGFDISIVRGARGSSPQRNRGLDLVRGDIGVVAFFDDDLVPSRHALEGMATFYAEHPEMNGASGTLLADGIRGPGITPDAALRMVADADAGFDGIDPAITSTPRALYGCNMCYRRTAISGLRFDEALPLYAWLEDLDFGGQLPQGTLAHTPAFYGVHCGEKRGRETSGLRLGYSQVCNPIYLLRKGTLPRRQGLRMPLRNIVRNHLGILRPEPWIDRRGRARGNRLALLDMLRGRLDPRRILDL